MEGNANVTGLRMCIVQKFLNLHANFAQLKDSANESKINDNNNHNTCAGTNCASFLQVESRSPRSSLVMTLVK